MQHAIHCSAWSSQWGGCFWGSFLPPTITGVPNRAPNISVSDVRVLDSKHQCKTLSRCPAKHPSRGLAKRRQLDCIRRLLRTLTLLPPVPAAAAFCRRPEPAHTWQLRRMDDSTILWDLNTSACSSTSTTSTGNRATKACRAGSLRRSTPHSSQRTKRPSRSNSGSNGSSSRLARSRSARCTPAALSRRTLSTRMHPGRSANIKISIFDFASRPLFR